MSAEWTAEPKPCAFCKKEDNGYALQDAKGVWQPACWPCVKARLKTLQTEDTSDGF